MAMAISSKVLSVNAQSADISVYAHYAIDSQGVRAKLASVWAKVRVWPLTRVKVGTIS